MQDVIINAVVAIWAFGFTVSMWFIPWHKMRRERTLLGKIAQAVAIVLASAFWFVALFSVLLNWQRR